MFVQVGNPASWFPFFSRFQGQFFPFFFFVLRYDRYSPLDGYWRNVEKAMVYISFCRVRHRLQSARSLAFWSWPGLRLQHQASRSQKSTLSSVTTTKPSDARGPELLLFFTNKSSRSPTCFTLFSLATLLLLTVDALSFPALTLHLASVA